MKELTEIAAKYAAEKTNEVMINAIAKAYADGYRDGYKDREEEIPIDLRSNETEYVDLGLPSGTLWAKDYEREEEDKIAGKRIIYLPYEKACHLSIPTKAQWEELVKMCRWEFEIDKNLNLCNAKCVAPNGKVLNFDMTGKKNAYTISNSFEVFFWVFEEKKGNEKSAIWMYNAGKSMNCKNGTGIVTDIFSGFKLPIRLVRTK